MSQNKKLDQQIKTTSIPLHLSINSNLGILNFLSEQPNLKLDNHEIELKKVQQDITYKSAIGKEQNEDDSQEEYTRKRTVNLNRIIVKSPHWKRKYYRADIPVNKIGMVQGRNRDKIHFILQFGNDNKGQLTVVDDIYDCQMEVLSDNPQNMMTFEEKIKMQNAKLDARRRQQRVQIVSEKKDNRKK